jgi:pilus assembly protein CpaF
MASIPAASPSFQGGQDLPRLKLWLADRIGSSLAKKVKLARTPEVIQLIHEQFRLGCQHTGIQLPPDREKVFFNEVLDEILGLGPLETFLNDQTITEIMVNGPSLVYVEKQGKLIESNVKFVDNDHVQKIINKIVEPLGRHVDQNSPMVDARLPDGSRVNAVVPPCAVDGPTITIRKFSRTPFTMQDLIQFGSLNGDMAKFLEACVVSKLNILVSGGTGSGKTTLLNVLSAYIPEGDRIVTIEDAAELSLKQRHVVRLETKHASREGDSRVTIRDLVINSLRMRPERIVVGECRGGEALDMLQAMNTGHDGSLTTVHANNPRDAISRLETLVLMAGMDLPIMVVRRQIASAVNLIVQQARLRDGSRKVIQIAEVTGMEGENIVMQDIFKFEDRGERDGKVEGEFYSTGLRPSYDERLKTRGFNLPGTMFMRRESARDPRRR